MDWVGFFAIWFWLNAKSVFNFYFPIKCLLQKALLSHLPLLSILFTSIRRTKVGQKGLLGQHSVFRQVFLPLWFCTVRGVMWNRENPPFIIVTTSSFQAKVANSCCSPFQWPPGEHTPGMVLPIAKLLQTLHFEICWRKQSNSLISTPSS